MIALQNNRIGGLSHGFRMLDRRFTGLDRHKAGTSVSGH